MAKLLPELTILGLMSGTSMDAIDGCVVRIQIETEPLKLIHAEILSTASHDYPATLKSQLIDAVKQTQVDLKTLCMLEQAVGKCFGQLAEQLCQDGQAEGYAVDAVASHGQTIYHVPPQNGQNGFSLQIGPPDVIAAACQRPVIADFRNADMALGGQGAPLVPFADQLLFQHPKEGRLIHNLGGISNVTVLPPANTGDVFAFDTGPANALIDGLMGHHFQRNFDENSLIARQGHVNTELLAQLIETPYLKQPPPKSTGKELFGQAFLERYFIHSDLSPEDQVRTALAFTVDSIVESYQHFVLPQGSFQEVIFGGGGTKNALLMQELSAKLATMGLRVSTHQDYGIPDQSKEALAFAILGYARLFDLPNTLAPCTGASKAVSGGAIWRKDLLSVHAATRIMSARTASSSC